MDQSLHIVIGMTIAYAASLLGLFIAWWSYKKRSKNRGKGDVDVRDND